MNNDMCTQQLDIALEIATNIICYADDPVLLAYTEDNLYKDACANSTSQEQW